MLLLVPLLLAVQQAEVPRTVNGQALGTAEAFATAGPARVCMKAVVVDVAAGETIHLDYAGIHSGVLRLMTGRRPVEVRVGDFAPGRRGRLMSARGTVRVYREPGSPVSYGVHAPSGGGEMGERRHARVSGRALTGTARDLALLDRITVGGAGDCDRTFAYGWDMLLGDEPVSRKKGE